MDNTQTQETLYRVVCDTIEWLESDTQTMGRLDLAKRMRAALARLDDARDAVRNLLNPRLFALKYAWMEDGEPTPWGIRAIARKLMIAGIEAVSEEAE